MQTATSISPNRQLTAFGEADGTVHVTRSVLGTPVFQQPGHSGPVKVLAWSPDGRLLASGGADQQIHVWDVTRGERLFTYSEHGGPISFILWRDNEHLVSAAGNDISSWSFTVPALAA